MTHRRLATLGLLLALTALAPAREEGPAVGRTYRIPYVLTETNHTLVRARINGKGPFNFVVDTGAPALYLSTEAAQQAGLKPTEDKFFTRIDRIDFEGGAYLDGLQVRVEDPFQLVGMNALGLPGVKLDGMLGYNALARFRIELDPTTDRMVWTRLDFEPKDLVVPRRPGEGPPPEVQMMGLLGGVAKFAAALIGKQPADQLVPRGFLGLELAEADGAVWIAAVSADSPASRAGVREGDRLVRLHNKVVDDPKAAHEAVAKVRPGDRVGLTVRRGEDTHEYTLTAGEGL